MTESPDTLSFYRPPFTGRTLEVIEIDTNEKENDGK